MMLKEIGSEFEYLDEEITKNGMDFGENSVFTFSGRSSIYILLKSLLEKREIRKIWYPSYCCESMVKPAIDLKIGIEFYDLNYSKDGILHRDGLNCNQDDIVLTMSYFGYWDNGNRELIRQCKNKGITVIEDITHSLLSDYEYISDYQVASLRKWFPIACGGLLIGVNKEKFAYLNDMDENLIEIRKEAMYEKTLYLSGIKDKELKQSFLRKYRIFNGVFSKYYEYKIDSWSKEILLHQNISRIKGKRRSNAKTLLNGLSSNKFVQPLFKQIRNEDCPLFFPIIVEQREELQKYLIENNIFCPIHWPKYRSNMYSNLYEGELSLICDQRYSVCEMKRIVEVIKLFYEER